MESEFHYSVHQPKPDWPHLVSVGPAKAIDGSLSITSSQAEPAAYAALPMVEYALKLAQVA